MAPPLQQLEGKYEILEKLREGGMGAIYKVRHRLLDEVRVVKVMRPHVAADPALRRRFLAEAKIAIRVRHPSIAQLYDFSVDEEGTALIVMEFIDGATLQDLIRDGRSLDLTLAVEIAVQTLQALACLHHNGIVHRDIAGDNLMLTRTFDGSPLVKLIDLGIAKDPIGEKTETGAFLGKARYAAPEQYRAGGSGSLGPAADLYSFGVLFYELLTARAPFEGDSFAEIVSGHLFSPPIPFERSDPDGRVPVGLREVILRSLEKDPSRRMASAEEYIEGLRAFRDSSRIDGRELERMLRGERAPAAERAADAEASPSQELLDEHFPPGTATPGALPVPPSPSPLGDAWLRTTATRLDTMLFSRPPELHAHEILAVLADERNRRAIEGERKLEAVLDEGCAQTARGEIELARASLRAASSATDRVRVGRLEKAIAAAEGYTREVETARKELERGRFEEALAACERACVLRPDSGEAREIEKGIRSRRAERAAAIAAECQGLLENAEREVADESRARRTLEKALAALEELKRFAGESGTVAMLEREIGRIGMLLTERREERRRRIASRLAQGMSQLDRARNIAGSADGNLEDAEDGYESARGHLEAVLEEEPSHTEASRALERIDEAVPVLARQIAERRARARKLADLLEQARALLDDALGSEAVDEVDLVSRQARLREGTPSLERARALDPGDPQVRALSERYDVVEAETRAELDRLRSERRRTDAAARETARAAARPATARRLPASTPDERRPARVRAAALSVAALLVGGLGLVAWLFLRPAPPEEPVRDDRVRDALSLPEDTGDSLERKAAALTALFRELPGDGALRGESARVLDLKDIQKRLDNLENLRNEIVGTSEGREAGIPKTLLYWEQLDLKLRPFLRSHPDDPTVHRMLRQALDHLRRLDEVLGSAEIKEKIGEAENLGG